MKLDTIASEKKFDTRILDVYERDYVIANYEIVEIKNDNMYINIITDSDSNYKHNMFDILIKYNIYVNTHIFSDHGTYYYKIEKDNLYNFPKIYDCQKMLFFACQHLVNITDMGYLTTKTQKVSFSNCSNLENFTGLKDIDINGVELKFDLSVGNTNIKNLSTLNTKNIISLDMGLTKNFDSYQNISLYKNLEVIYYSTTLIHGIKSEISHSIELLLCKKLTTIIFPDEHKMLGIIAKYIKKDLNVRKDHIMDCALELIDAGFEKAAEL